MSPAAPVTLTRPGPGPRVVSGLMSLDPKLFDVLVCPKDKGPLVYLEKEQRLVNERLGIAYRIDEGIPVLLVDEAEAWPPDTAGE